MNQHTQELEKNELVDWLEAKLGHLRPHLTNIILGFVLVIVLIVSIMMYRYSQQEIAGAQWQQLNTVMNQFSFDQQTDRFIELAEAYPDEVASLWALQIAGLTDMQAGLENLIGKRPEAVRQLEKARKSFLRVLESKGEKSADLMQRTLFGLATTHEALGEFEDAKKVFQQLSEEYPESFYTDAVKRALDRLQNPQTIAFFDKFKTVGIAPGAKLPVRPDISFPDLD